MARKRLFIPIRLKIVAILVTSLTISLLSYLRLGTSLIVEDKASYIYDFNLAEVGAAVDRVENHFRKTMAVGQVVSGVSDTLPEEELLKIYAQQAGPLGNPEMVLLRPVSATEFQLIRRLGGQAGDAGMPAWLAWNPENFKAAEYLVGSPVAGKVPLGGKGFDSRGRPVAFVALLQLPESLLGEDGPSLFLFDATGGLTLASVRGNLTSRVESVRAKVPELQQGAFATGARDWDIDGERYMVSYRRMASGGLLGVGLVPQSVAFSAAQSLTRRSLALGVSILLLAIGFSLFVVKRITVQLNRMWHATQKVQEGDFTVRVDETNSSSDEIGSLATSFNAMADKIGDLMRQTAEKARMEKELETAQEVQNRFLPVDSLEGAEVGLAGLSIPATECGGDWWHYRLLGRKLLVVIGDVNGHGVPSALLTAAAYGAYSMMMRHYEGTPGVAPSVTDLMENLNAAVYASSHGKIGMTMLVTVLDLDTGELQYSNASHRPLYVVRKGETKPLMDGDISALGLQPTLGASVATAQLEAGDTLLWFTDGLVECPNPEGRTLSTARVGRLLAKLIAEHGAAGAPAVCKALMAEYSKFLGDAFVTRPDDTTLVIGTIPDTAAFKAAPASQTKIAA